MYVAEASLIGKNGFMWTAVPGTEAPEDWETADLVKAATGASDAPASFADWEFLGASSLENLPGAGNDGGDTDVKGSWDGLLSRQVQTEASVDYLTINPYQLDRMVMSMYWGQGTYDPETKRFVVSNVGGTPLERAFLLLVADGPARVGLHSWKAGFSRDDSYALSTEDYTEWPIRATWLSYPGKGLFEWLGVADSPALAAAGTGGSTGGTGGEPEPAA